MVGDFGSIAKPCVSRHVPHVRNNVNPSPAATSHPLNWRSTIRLWASSSQGRRVSGGAQHGGSDIFLTDECRLDRVAGRG